MMHVLKALIGGVVSGAISILSQTQFFLLAGILPFFPTFALISHISAYQSGDIAHAKSVYLFMIFAVIPIIGYNICMYVLIDRLNFVASMAYALAVWFALGLALYFIWMKIVS